MKNIHSNDGANGCVVTVKYNTELNTNQNIKKTISTVTKHHYHISVIESFTA